MRRRVPRVGLSPLDVVAGTNAGARHHVTKPFGTADLLAHLGHMVTRRS